LQSPKHQRGKTLVTETLLVAWEPSGKIWVTDCMELGMVPILFCECRHIQNTTLRPLVNAERHQLILACHRAGESDSQRTGFTTRWVALSHDARKVLAVSEQPPREDVAYLATTWLRQSVASSFPTPFPSRDPPAYTWMDSCLTEDA
jgi:hypothetical protein